MMEKNYVARINRKILSLGIPPTHQGFVYLVEGIRQQMELGLQGRISSKCLYANIADFYNVSTMSVETSMRRSIQYAWQQNESREKMQKVFEEISLGQVRRRPSTNEFIVYLAWALLLESM